MEPGAILNLCERDISPDFNFLGNRKCERESFGEKIIPEAGVWDAEFHWVEKKF